MSDPIESEIPKPTEYSRSEFEANKTQRITALCGALEAVCKNPKPVRAYGGTDGERDAIFQQLIMTCQEFYTP